VIDYDNMIEGLAEFTPSCSRLVTCDEPGPDVPEAVSEHGLGWAGEVYHYDDSVIRPEFEGSPVYQLRDGRYAIIKDGELVEVSLEFTVTARLQEPL
jgi:hypothetical protein